jgi:hypothetical protein
MVECLGLTAKPIGLSEVSHRYLTCAGKTGMPSCDHPQEISPHRSAAILNGKARQHFALRRSVSPVLLSQGRPGLCGPGPF